MTLKDLFEKNGDEWLADQADPHEKVFRPLGYGIVSGNPTIIGEMYDGTAAFYFTDDDFFIPWTPKPKTEEETLKDQLRDVRISYDVLLEDYAKNKAEFIYLNNKNKKLKEQNKIMLGALETMQSGFAGMFGHQTVDPKDEAWEMCPNIIKNALKKVKDLGDDGESETNG